MGAVRRPRKKAEDTRAEILDVAERLFAERGISGCSIAHIAQALGMSPANVFKHFHSKVALADAICDRRLDKMSIGLKALETTAPAPERLGIVARTLMELHLTALRDTPFLFEMIFILSGSQVESSQHYQRMIEDIFADVIRHGNEAGIYRCRDPQTRSQAVAAAFATVLHPIYLKNVPSDELLQRCDGIVELVNLALQNPLA